MAAKVLLIDGNNLVHRAYHALPSLTTASGQPTNAVYGLVQMLLPLLESERPDRVLVAFDPPVATFRSELDANYKANRAETEPELVAQMDLTRELVDALGLGSLEVAGYEADDVIGTVARQASEVGDEVLIVSADRDLVQLVGPRVQVLAPLKGVSDMKRYDEAVVSEEYGVRPEQLVDIKALAGDTSDNIPGVPGIGPVGATSLIQEFGNLETLLSRLDEVQKAGLRTKLQENEAAARLSYDLGRIRRDVPLPEGASAPLWQGPRVAVARQLFARLEFGNLLARTGAWGSLWEGEVAAAEEAGLVALCAQARAAGQLTVVPVAAPDGKQFALALSVGSERALVWVLPESSAPAVGGLFAEETAPALPECLASALADASLPKQGCRLKEAAAWLRAYDATLEGFGFDAEVADYVLNPARTDHDVLLTAARELGWWVGVDAEAQAGLPVWQVRGGVEALATERLRATLEGELAQAGLEDIFREVECPLAGVLAQMEGTGITVDVPRLEQLSRELQTALAGIAERAYALAGQSFNLDSPKQVGEVLFEGLKLGKGKKTKTGWSTGAEVLEELAEEHEIARRILEHRELAKLRSTYVEALLREADPVTQRIHTTFEQTVTATGRLSSRSPNLQNIPVRTAPGREIRACFIAAPGQQLIKADYSQIELRLLAHFCHDPNLVEAFQAGEDIHARTAALIFNVERSAVTSDMRRVAKTVNFAVLYGMGSTALAQQLGIKRTEAQEFIDGYFARLGAVRAYLDGIVESGREAGYVTTLLGRRRPMPDLRSSERQTRAYAERAAANTPLQGSAADLVKVAMVRLAKLLPSRHPASRLLLQVHDELVLEAPAAEAAAVGATVREVMEQVVTLSVPLVVEVAVGDNWRDMQTVGR